MIRRLTVLFLFLLLLIVPFAGRYLSFYGLNASQHEPPDAYQATEVATLVPTPAAATFEEAPAVGRSLVLLDQSHGNMFALDDIGYLDSRLAARGAEIVQFITGDLRSALRPVDAFVVLAPLEDFEDAEIVAVRDFVARGGKLMMVGDPTRYQLGTEEDEFGFIVSVTVKTDELPLNSLANAFGITFNGDYLYNTEENEGNFRNIVTRREDFAESPLTNGLEQLAFYGVHSVSVGPEGESLIAGSDDVWSSDTDRSGGLLLGVTSHDERVVALGDIDFLADPYATVFDNRQFIAGLADFLTESSRAVVLADFPYFFQQPVQLIYSGSPDLGPNAFDEIIDLQEAFRLAGRPLTLASEAGSGHDTLYLGLYNQAGDVAEILASAGISLTIDPPVLTRAEQEALEAKEEELAEEEAVTEEDSSEREAPIDEEEEEIEPTPTPSVIRLLQSDLGNVQMAGTSLVLLHEDSDGRHVVVLAASGEGLESAVNRLLDIIPTSAENALGDCLLQATLALCPTGIGGEEIEAELLSGGEPAEIEEVEADPPDEETDEDVEDEEGEDEEDSESAGDPDYDAIGAAYQGDIGLGETVEAELLEEEAHGWTLRVEGPTLVNIVTETDTELLDMVLEIYEPDGTFVTEADNTFDGEGEQLLGFEVPAGAIYAIVVRDFFDGPGEYTLTVSESTSQGGVFIYADDDDTPLGQGFTSADTFEAALAGTYEVTVWRASENDALTGEDIAGYELIIWTSGDYAAADLFESEDAAVLFESVFLNENSKLLITGAVPSLLAQEPRALLSDMEVAGTDTTLLDGFVEGDIIELADTYESSILEIDSLIEEDGDILLFMRGPGSEETGQVVGIASDSPETGTQIFVLITPFSALPEETQSLLFANIMDWFGLASP